VRFQRGFSLAELLTVLVIIGLLMSVVAISTPLFLRGPREAQSQVDNVESAALALYKMQHDARPSTIKGVYSCTTLPVPTCSQPMPSSPLPMTQALVILTANGNGQFSLKNNGAPNWQGFIVYWLTPNADGSSNELRRAFVNPGISDPPTLPEILAALNAALGLSNYTTVAQDVQDMRFAVDTTTNSVDLQLDGGDKNGNKSSLRLSGNSYVRN